MHDHVLELSILDDQWGNCSYVHQYFYSKSRDIKGIPNINSQLDIFRNNRGILRMCKLKKNGNFKQFRILMAKNCRLTELLIIDSHKNVKHGDKYSVLAKLKPKFWTPKCFSAVKKYCLQVHTLQNN